MLAAQEESGPDSPGDVFNLPEFVVSGDSGRGYTATNSLTGTFLDTPLKDTPFAIDVFMPDLISDTGSTDMREILAYDSGLQLENTIAAQGGGTYALGTEFDARGIQNNETDIVTRGFRAPTLKNGFFTKTRVDTVNIDRVERAGGPQSLLYGIGTISGITNVITKRPLPERRTSAEVFAGSNDFYRATFETTGPLLEKEDYSIGYIASIAAQSEGTEYPHEKNETLFIAPGVQLKAWGKTSVLLSLEQGWRTQSGQGFKDLAFPFKSDVDAPFPFGGVVLPNGTVQRQTGEDTEFLRDYLGRGNYVNLGGPDATIEDDVLTANVEITQQIGEHFRALVSYNRDRQFQDERRFLISEIVPDFADPLDSDLIYAFGDQYEDRITEQVRLALLGSFEFFGGVHTLVVGRQEFSESKENIEFHESSYYKTTEYIEEFGKIYSEWPLDGSSIRYRREDLVGPWRKNDFNEWYQGNYILYQGSIWKGRINPVLGYRWDRSHSRFMRADFDEQDGTLGEFIDPLVGRGTVNGYANGGKPFEVETPTAGISVALNDSLSIYGLYGEGIALSNTAQRDGLDRGFPPEFTRNREVGAKFSLFGGKVSGRLTYFNLQKRGGIRYSFYAPNPSRGNFDPDEPITAAILAGTAGNPNELRRFMEFLGVYNTDGNPATDDFLRFPLDLPGVERVFDGQGRPFFIFPYGEVGDPGQYDPENNTAPNGYGQDLLAYIQRARELEAEGIGQGSPQYMWSSMGNHPGEDRGAYHNFDEESTGYEARLMVTPIENWQMIFSYTYNVVEISKGLSALVDPVLITGLEPWFWYLNPDDFGESGLPSSYSGSLSSGVRNTDVPVHSFTFWSKYEFLDGFLEGLDVRFGARYTSERAAEAPWAKEGGGFNDAIERGLGGNTKADVPEYTLYDVGLGYQWEWKGLQWRANLNVRNLFDKRELIALSDSRTVGGLPEVTYYTLDGREVRFSLRISF
ncbi:MAG: TonB-dependent siderophore receptor [Oceanipulchritudo sp.]